MSNNPPPPKKNEPPKPDPERTKAISALRTRLIHAIHGISVKSATSARSVLDSFGLKCSPSMAADEGSGFPVTIRPHGANADKSMNTTRPALLFFHVGSAILAYYKVVTFPGEQKFLDALEKRVKFVERLNAEGVDNFVPMGNDRTGFALMHKDEAKKVEQARQEAANAGA